jgi:hypothetical protein
MRTTPRVLVAFALAAGVLVGAGTSSGASGPGGSGRSEPATVIDHWTAGRRAAAVPRDLVLDERGLGYLRLPGGALRPYGHDVAAVIPPVRAAAPSPAAKPGGDSGGGGSTADTTAPVVTDLNPAAGATIGAAHTFSAKVTDASGVKSVSFVITYPDNRTQSFSASATGNDVWAISFSGFTNGSWKWHVVAKDNGPKGGNTATTDKVSFTVDTGSGSGGGGGGGGSGDGVVTNAAWTDAKLSRAVGRIYFEMPANPKHTRWSGYVCSGTAVQDATTNTVSIILTAAHCVYDDVYKAFARNVLFIPDQAGTTATGTDRNCANDPIGCWAPSHGVVDADWSTRTWPDNIPWDYAYYVVPTSGRYTPGLTTVNASLELALVTPPSIQFTAPATGTVTHALGYSYSEDPKLMYCAESLATTGAANWWLSQCGLSGGASGGPWIQPMTGGTGPIVSVNSWGYRDSPGMAGPKLSGTSASCLFTAAQTNTTSQTGGLIPQAC